MSKYLFKSKSQFPKYKSFIFHPREASSNNDAFCVEIPKVEFQRNERKVIECKDPIWPGRRIKNLRDYKSILKLYEKVGREAAETYRKQTKANRGRLG